MGRAGRVSARVVSMVFSLPSLAAHSLLIVSWMLFVEPYPWGGLITALSVEAIYLTMFVGISQKADHAEHVERMSELHARLGEETK